MSHLTIGRSWRVAALLASVVAFDCAPNPTEPAPLDPPSNVGTLPEPNDISGVVVEFATSGAKRPVQKLQLKVRTAGPKDGPLGGVELPDVFTDQNGSFVIENAPAPLLFIQTAPGSAFHFLCSHYPISRIRQIRSLEIPVVPDNWSGDSVPGGFFIVGTSVQGKVVERVGDALQPVAGATVALDGGTFDPAATTNGAGYYMVCSVVGTDQYRELSVEKPGYQTVTRRIFGGWDVNVNVELIRQ